MDSIEDIYSNDIYYPFILYCQAHGYRTMLDLRRCAMSTLGNEVGMTPMLLMRIKSLYTAYYRQHPDLHMGSNAPKPLTPRKPAMPVVAGLEARLEDYFKAHRDTLIRVTDLCKELGLKKLEVARTLENANWCKSVGSASFFYAPQ